MRILLVEDIQSMRLLMRHMLRSMGLNDIIEAIDGSTAIQVLQAEKIDLIVSDWLMEPLSGLDLLRHVRADKTLAPIPFIMVSCQNTAENIGLAHKTGVNGYLIKPFGMTTFSKQIRRFIEIPAPSKKTVKRPG